VLVFENARIWTQDRLRPQAQALAVADGRILGVGTGEEMRALLPKARIIDLGGRCLVPGFNDAHAHIWKIGHLLTSMVDLRQARSIRQMGDLLQVAADRGGHWIVGRGYNEAQLAEGRMPTRHDLDQFVKDRPVYLTRTCGHIGLANSRALELAGVGVDTPAPAGGAIDRDERGQPTGTLKETAMGLVSRIVPEPSAQEYARMIQATGQHHLKLGITSATDAGVTPEILEVYRHLDKNGELLTRINVMALRRPLGGTQTYPLPERFESDMLRVDSIKLLADGGLSGATAALRRPYRHCDDTGLLRLDADELHELVKDAHAADLRIGIHAIGDAAIDVVLDVYERLPRKNLAHRIEHFGLPDPHQLERSARLGLIAVPQAIFLTELGVNFRRYLPDAMIPQAYPLRSVLAAGIPMALSSDAPVVCDDNPLSGIQAALTRCDATGVAICPDESISVHEALLAYTLGGAVASGDAGNRGSLTPGKWADLAVLSGDPTQVEDLSTVRVDMTWLGGQLVYER
jgi:predicted amidohydrolase YtcJ